MSRFRLREIRVDNYRCFEELKLSLEEDTTVLFAENGGGKTALLTALAMGLAVFQSGAPRTLKLDPLRDPRMRTDKGRRREPVGPCKVAWTATVGESESVTWSTAAHPASGRTTNQRQPILEALERVRVPGDRWPLFAWYGVDRLERRRAGRRKVERMADRWEAYASALDPNLDEAPLLQWLQDELLGDVVRRQQDEPERFFDAAVMDATVQATPGVTKAWYDPEAQGPVVRFENGHEAPWSELSDGYHVFIALVADIARRAVMLNEFDGADAPARVEGVVLIDKLDLHLHPRWQRVAPSGPSQRIPETSIRRHHPLAAGAEQRQEPPGAPALRRKASGIPRVGREQRHERDPPRAHEHRGTRRRGDPRPAEALRLYRPESPQGSRGTLQEAAGSLGRPRSRVDSSQDTHGPGGVRCVAS